MSYLLLSYLFCILVCAPNYKFQRGLFTFLFIILRTWLDGITNDSDVFLSKKKKNLPFVPRKTQSSVNISDWKINERSLVLLLASRTCLASDTADWDDTNRIEVAMRSKNDMSCLKICENREIKKFNNIASDKWRSIKLS